METKELDLGGGWRAVIRRPPIDVIAGWNELDEDAKAPKEPPPPAGQPEAIAAAAAAEAAKEPKKLKLTRAHYRYAETDLLPAAVVRYTDPAGLVREVAKLYVPDLGIGRFAALLSGIFAFVNEAESSFRPEDTAAAA